MTSNEQLAALLSELEKYSEHCEFFSAEGRPESPNSLFLKFKGKFIQGISENDVDFVEPEFCDSQEIEICIPSEFPASAPQVNWRSEIFHPNIALDSSVSLSDIGLNWNPDMTIPIVCERLWDVARLAYIESDDPANSSAGNWFKNKIKIELPLDHRRFELDQAHGLVNIFSYRRKGAFVRKPPVISPDQASSDIMFIDD